MLKILLNKDKVEISREDVTEVPTGGYENNYGVFYKTEGDPRCITDLEKIQKKAEKIKSTVQTGYFNRNYNKSSTKIYTPFTKPISHYLGFLSNYTCTTSTDKIAVFGANIKDGMGFTTMISMKWFSKIQFDFNNSTIRIWRFNLQQDEPDIVIEGGLKIDD